MFLFQSPVKVVLSSLNCAYSDLYETICRYRSQYLQLYSGLNFKSESTTNGVSQRMAKISSKLFCVYLY